MIGCRLRQPSYAPVVVAIGSALGASAATAAVVGTVALTTAATVGASLYTSSKAASAAKKEGEKTRRAETQAQQQADAQDKARRMNVDSSESATTTFGVTQDKKKELVSNDLLIPINSQASIGGTSGRVGLGF